MFHKDPIPQQLILPKQEALKLVSLNAYIHELSKVPHRHDHYQLMWITKGHGYQSIDGISYAMETNRVFLIHTGQIHKMEDLERGGWMILFSDLLYKRVMQLFPELEQYGITDIAAVQPYVDLDDKGISVYQHILLLLKEEQQSGNPDGRLLEVYLSTLLLVAKQSYEAENNKRSPSHEAQVLLKTVKRLLEQHFRQEQQVSFYCDQLHLHPRKLNALLKTYYGMTMHDLIQQRLLMESGILLASSPMNIKEIAYHLGFSDPAYFNRFFKKNMGVTPAQYRDTHML